MAVECLPIAGGLGVPSVVLLQSPVAVAVALVALAAAVAAAVVKVLQVVVSPVVIHQGVPSVGHLVTCAAQAVLLPLQAYLQVAQLLQLLLVPLLLHLAVCLLHVLQEHHQHVVPEPQVLAGDDAWLTMVVTYW